MKILRKKAKKFLPLQPGDVPNTYADVNDLMLDFNYKPQTTVNDGIHNFVEWFMNYYRQ